MGENGTGSWEGALSVLTSHLFNKAKIIPK